MAKSRNYALDLIRSVAIIMIVNFHLSYELESRGFFYSFGGVDWGSVGTAVFFILSGFTLALRYEGEMPKYIRFVKGRFLSLFPMFYFIYFIAFVFYSIQVKSIHWGGSLWRLVFTVFGADSWVGFFGIGSFYLVGEWFTFAIFTLYLLFPMLLRALRARMWVRLLVTAVIAGLYAFRVISPIGPIPKDASFETILALFWLGMLIFNERERIEKRPAFVGMTAAVAGIIFLAFIRCDTVWFHDIIACMAFLGMYSAGRFIRAGSAVAKGVAWFSGISYAVYLWHHFVLRRIHSAVWTRMSRPVHTALYIAVSYALTILLAWMTCQLFSRIKARRSKQ